LLDRMRQPKPTFVAIGHVGADRHRPARGGAPSSAQVVVRVGGSRTTTSITRSGTGVVR
jgi:hypothetical protein